MSRIRIIGIKAKKARKQGSEMEEERDLWGGKGSALTQQGQRQSIKRAGGSTWAWS